MDGSSAKHASASVRVDERYTVGGVSVSGDARSGSPLKLKADVSGDTSGLKYKFVWERDGWADWGVVDGTPSDSPEAVWTPTAPGSYTVILDVMDGTEYRSVSCRVVVTGYSIMGVSDFTSKQLADCYLRQPYVFPATVYSAKGAASIYDFCYTLVAVSRSEGVRPEVVFAQAMLETGWLRFGGSVKPEACNFAGIGAINSQVGGAVFPDVKTGLLAQVQHLKAYACLDDLVNPCVDPRFSLVKRGCAPCLEDLNGRWAVPGSTYGQSIVRIIHTI